ncbi:uncharacterized protein LOC127249505 [Andrographis paniculata]|uniref:uncharacterized protein LOC127249505 n=1 Tax=Andrographis paniculata TaxID=175694 RepID=UPI0021E93849|nr:uncharacterized protein LOC127249505 [Andrographis paniculata]XP_051128273.1 uncharacterized protein LOC127249505 [Andrographis paniculata]
MGIFQAVVRFFAGKSQDDDDRHRHNPYLRWSHTHYPNLHRRNPSSRISSSGAGDSLNIFAYCRAAVKFLWRRFVGLFSTPARAEDPLLPVQIPPPYPSNRPSLLENLIVSPSDNGSFAYSSSPERSPAAGDSPVTDSMQGIQNLLVSHPDNASSTYYTSPESSPAAGNSSVTGGEPPEPVIVSIPDIAYWLSLYDERTVESSVFVQEISPPANVSRRLPEAAAKPPPAAKTEETAKKKRRKKKKAAEGKGKESAAAEVIIIERRATVERGRWIKHYCNRHRILVVGDGDFSFSASLAAAFISAPNMFATSLDSLEFLKKNYDGAASNINELRVRKCTVMHGVDATKLAGHQLLGKLKFDRIVFNFPFAGFFKELPRDSQLRRHRRLVSLFLKNAKEMVKQNGEIHITHKTNGFHEEWKVEGIASSHRLRLMEAVEFNLEDYPGYRTKCGFGGDANFFCKPSKTYKFGLR